MNLSIGILSGGRSLRFGSDKALLKINNKSFIQRAVDEFKDFDDIIISVNKETCYSLNKVRFAVDSFTQKGPLGGIYEILKVAQNDWTFIFAVDMPFINTKVLEYLYQFVDEKFDAIVFKDEKRVHPLCGIYHGRLVDKIEADLLVGKNKASQFLETIDTKYVPIELSCFDGSVLDNINTVESFERIKKPELLCICGFKNSGKTTLISKLIEILSLKGYKVGLLKHDVHDFEFDNVGTDTYKARQAGAVQVGIFNDVKFGFINYSYDSKLEKAIELFDNIDLIIVEGHKNSELPKLEIVRKGISESINSNRVGLLGVITDFEFQNEYREFNLNCPADLADYIIEEILSL